MLRYLLRVERGAKKHRLQKFHQGSARENGMSYDALTRPTNWLRVAAIVLGCVAVFAGIVINRDRAASGIDADIIEQYRTNAILYSERLEAAQAAAREAEDERRLSDEASGRALAELDRGAERVEAIVGALGEISTGDREIDALVGSIDSGLQRLADDLRRVRNELADAGP